MNDQILFEVTRKINRFVHARSMHNGSKQVKQCVYLLDLCGLESEKKVEDTFIPAEYTRRSGVFDRRGGR